MSVKEPVLGTPDFFHGVTWIYSPGIRHHINIILALIVGGIIWQLPPPPPLDEKAMHFLAILTTGIALWIFDIFDEYLVALMMLFSWLILEIVPPKIALAGFSKSSWFFVLGIFGISAAISKCGLFNRLILRVLLRLRPDYKFYTYALTALGLMVTAVLPTSKARIAMAVPVSKSMAETMGFKPRSNGSAGIALAAYVGFSQGAFIFLTGATPCLIGWNLLPEGAKAEFGWGTWLVAALPAGLFTLAFLVMAVLFLFPVKQEQGELNTEVLENQLKISGSMRKEEWLSLAVLAIAIVGWLGKPFHGVGETVVTLGALLVILIGGVLSKDDLKKRVDWTFLIFLGIMSGLDGSMRHLGVNRLLSDLVGTAIVHFTFNPLVFLTFVTLLVYFVRFFFSKIATVILLSTIGLSSWGASIGIHPAVVLLTIVMAMESWFLIYQNDAYQIAYASTEGKAFSHGQARKLMVARFLASFIAVAISVPYWRMLGLIE